MKSALRQPQSNCFLVVYARSGYHGVKVSEMADWEITDMADRAPDSDYEDFSDACDLAFDDGNYWLFDTTEELIAFKKTCKAHNAGDIRIAIDDFLEIWL